MSKITRAAAGWIAAGLVAAILIGVLLFGNLHFSVSTAPIPSPVLDTSRSPAAAQCPTGWKSTTGTDPDSRYNFVTCTDSVMIITIRENQQPTGFNTKTGQFLSAGEVSTILNAPR